MITKFKIFEKEDQFNNEISFSLDELLEYYTINGDVKRDSIYSFLHSVLKFDNMIMFYCKYCQYYDNGSLNYAHCNNGEKIHKGLIREVSLGFYEYDKKIYLSLTLNNVKYSHEVYTSKPITIYGNIDQAHLNIINEINAKRDSNKYNL
jgi:hypothetical protein